ncbi:hypothetical protein CASFOL_000690 [Castilleja foliolosa]|uniref:Uncharacterized protein n=1 Tax=Castilleja foliolosa TaxID=1961234 RepID=A0ABD3EP83_9LAMI
MYGKNDRRGMVDDDELLKFCGGQWEQYGEGVMGCLDSLVQSNYDNPSPTQIISNPFLIPMIR